jgi:hypothetical protein
VITTGTTPVAEVIFVADKTYSQPVVLVVGGRIKGKA